MAYRGDVFPYVPIAAELATRGHDVRFVLPREFHPLLAGEPFRCVHSGTDFGPEALDEHRPYAAGFKAYRRRLGLPTEGWNLIAARLSPHLTLGLASPAYIDAHPDWPARYRLTGFSTWAGPRGEELPAEVAAFLDAGEPPIV